MFSAFYGSSPLPAVVPGKAQLVPGTSIKSAMLQLTTMDHIKTVLPRSVRNMTLDDVADESMRGLDHIGNKYYAQYVMVAEPSDDGCIDIPDNCHDIDYIVNMDSMGGIGRTATSIDEQLWIAAQPMRSYSSLRDEELSMAPATASADPIPGEGGGFRRGQRWVGPLGAWASLQQKFGKPLSVALRTDEGGIRLQLAEWTGMVLISYKARVCDGRGWPMITYKEALSCAYWCAWVDAHDKFMARELNGDQYKAAKMIWEESLTPARNEGLADKGGLEAIANTLTSFHRHLYGSVVPLTW